MITTQIGSLIDRAHKTLETGQDCSEPGEILDTVVGLIHAEAAEEENVSGVEKKLVKNL